MDNDMNDDGTDWIGLFGHMFLLMIIAWAAGSAWIINGSYVLNKPQWQCVQLTEGECSRYDRK